MVHDLAQKWLSELEWDGFKRNPLTGNNVPQLTLEKMIN
jgi:hypothetical protein